MSRNDDLSKETRANLLEEAQQQINDAIANIRLAVSGLGREESYAERYIIGHLNNWANGEGEMDTTIPKMIEDLENM